MENTVNVQYNVKQKPYFPQNKKVLGLQQKLKNDDWFKVIFEITKP